MESVESVLRNYGDRVELLQETLGRLHDALRQMAQSSSETSDTRSSAQSIKDASGGDVEIQLPPLEVAQLHVASAFATCTLVFDLDSRHPKIDAAAAKRFVHFHTSRHIRNPETSSLKDPKSNGSECTDVPVQHRESYDLGSGHPHGSRKQKQKKPRKQTAGTSKGRIPLPEGSFMNAKSKKGRSYHGGDVV